MSEALGNNRAAKLTRVHLAGSLGKRFGKVWQLDVKSPAEAVRAIDINTKGAFAAYLSGPAKNKPYKVALQKKDNAIGREELANRSGHQDIWIIPTIRGANSGTAKVIVGAILVVVGVVFYNPYLISMGLSLMLGGILQLMTPVPKAPEEQPNSNVFQGNASAVTQGGCVPLVYGRALVAPAVVGISLDNDDIATTVAGSVGGPVAFYPDGGGVQYNYNPYIPTADDPDGTGGRNGFPYPVPVGPG